MSQSQNVWFKIQSSEVLLYSFIYNYDNKMEAYDGCNFHNLDWCLFYFPML